MSDFSINIKDVCGRNIVTRDDGKRVHDIIIRQWKKSEKIKIDFGNVLIASVSFIDEIFGKIAFEFDRQEVSSKLQMLNIQEFDRALLNDILASRYKQKELENSKSLYSTS